MQPGNLAMFACQSSDRTIPSANGSNGHSVILNDIAIYSHNIHGPWPMDVHGIFQHLSTLFRNQGDGGTFAPVAVRRAARRHCTSRRQIFTALRLHRGVPNAWLACERLGMDSICFQLWKSHVKAMGKPKNHQKKGTSRPKLLQHVRIIQAPAYHQHLESASRWESLAPLTSQHPGQPPRKVTPDAYRIHWIHLESSGYCKYVVLCGSCFSMYFSSFVDPSGEPRIFAQARWSQRVRWVKALEDRVWGKDLLKALDVLQTMANHHDRCLQRQHDIMHLDSWTAGQLDSEAPPLPSAVGCWKTTLHGYHRFSFTF